MRINDRGSQAGHVVRRPLPSDGIGHALRAIFDRSAALPADMAALLARLDRQGRRAR